VKGLNRRQLLTSGALALVPPGRVTFGANSHAWPGFSKAIPQAGLVRVYWHGVNLIQDTWPIYGRARVVLSFEPRPRDLLRGHLDAKLLRLASTAPPGSMIVPLYEAGPSNPRDYYAWANASNVTACQGYLHRLLKRTNVRTGSIICGPASQLENWMAPGLDWYGVDINGDWFRHGTTFETARFRKRQAENLAVWRRKASGRVRLVVGETNCSLASVQGEWLAMLAGWWAQQGLASVDISTFWAAAGRKKLDNDGAQPSVAGNTSWPPPEYVVDQIQVLARKYAPRLVTERTTWGGGGGPG
jgi:hypothetical protein